MAAFTKPLLHMWSLAVEEQFYWVTPFILLGMTAATTKTNPESVGKTWVAITLGLAIVSLGACVAFTYPLGRPNVSFYIMPTRGWEFILGGIAPSLSLALRKWPDWISYCLGLTGIAAIGLAVGLFDADTLYPSYHAILPAFGAMLIIVSGLTDPRNSVARALSTWPMVYTGLISYALYLWHWPLISFVRTMNYGRQNISEEIGVVAMSFALAVLTYHFIELPVRRWRRSHQFRPVVVVSVGAVSCILVASIGYVWALQIAPHFLPAVTGLEPVAITSSEYPSVSHRGILLGDFHANALEEPLKEYARRAGSLLNTMARAGCAPLLQTAVTSDRGEPAVYCPPFFNKIDFHGAEFVIVVARWNYYLGLPPSDPYYPSAVLVAKRATGKPANPYEALAMGLTATISEAEHSGVRRILIVGPLPEFPWNAPYCVMRSVRVGVNSCSIARATVEARRKRTMEALHRVVTDFEGLRLIDPIDLFCTAKACSPNEGRKLFFSDTNHLSTAGAERLYKAYEHDFLWVLTGK